MDFSDISTSQIAAMYFFVEMLALVGRTRFPISSDLTLRNVLRNFGDDFTKFYIQKEHLGVRSVGFFTSTWEAVCKYAAPLYTQMDLVSQIRFNSGTKLKKKNDDFLENIKNQICYNFRKKI
jgi:hypothetical protein